MSQQLQPTAHMADFNVQLGFIAGEIVGTIYNAITMLSPSQANQIMFNLANFIMGMVDAFADDHPLKNQISKSGRPVVQGVDGDHSMTIWYKTICLYMIWAYVGELCEIAAWPPLLFNDGGKFYNECYYMFYNGVVWYNAPKPYKF